jgi:hypothetical protein
MDLTKPDDAIADLPFGLGGRTPGCAAEAAGFSVGLAVALDLWGQVVAYRAGCRVGVRWADPRNRSSASRIGLALQPATLAANWRAAIEGEVGIPKDARLALWTVRMALETRQVATPHRRSLPALKGHPSDIEACRLAFLAVDHLLSPDIHWRSKAGGQVQASLVRLYVVPHLYEDKGSLRTVVPPPKRWLGPYVEGEELDRLKVWSKRANWRMSIRVPDLSELLE